MQSELNLKSDEELMLLYQKGEHSAFEMLYKRHSMKVYGYLRNNLKNVSAADDALQSTFLKLHSTRLKYDSTFPFLPWLFTVCKSVMIDQIRKSQRVKEISGVEYLEQAQEEVYQKDAFPDLSILSSLQKDAISLRYRDDLSFDEIAQKLETTAPNARKLISRAIKKLKENFRKE